MKKAWWRSKTLWINLIAGAVFILQSQYGVILDPGAQGAILVVVNLVLRGITREPIGLQDETAPPPFPGLDAGGPGVKG